MPVVPFAPMAPDLCVACGSEAADVVLADGEDYEYRVPGRFRFVRCRRCDLVFMSPRPARGELLSFYPRDYHAYERPTSRLFALLDRFNRRRRVRGYLRHVASGRGDMKTRSHRPQRTKRNRPGTRYS